MRYVQSFLLAVLAGICIALGGTVFLILDNKVLGALFFAVGLFTICTFGFNLFTGKICYVFEQNGDYAFGLLVIWLGNLIGTWLTAFIERLTRIGSVLAEKAAVLCKIKLEDEMLSIFLLAVLCNVLIYIAVDGFKNNPHELGKYLSLFLGVAVFILCGFEHCVANMYYFSVARMWSGKTLLYIFIMTTGNSLGGIIFPFGKKLCMNKP